MSLQFILPVLTEKRSRILFTTARGIMGYGVSGGAAGGISIRGLSGSTARMMVLIDGHPQYAGIFGHPISDAYQSLLADKIEVLRVPASVLYGSKCDGWRGKYHDPKKCTRMEYIPTRMRVWFI